MGKFTIKTGKDGSFYFNLKADNGQIILRSDGYTTKSACENGINSVKNNAINENRFEKLVSSAGKPFFNLKASNGQIVGTSQLYESENGRDNGIDSVMRNAPDAPIVLDDSSDD